MTIENVVYDLNDGEEVGCYFCVCNEVHTQYSKGQAFLAGPSHSPFHGNANHVCKRHLDSDAVIHPLPTANAILSCERIVPERPLLVGAVVFQCPYCDHQWLRGGHKEGFVKAGAFRHVFGCRQVLLFDHGYVPGQWIDGLRAAVRAEDAHPKQIRSAQMLKKAREKAGHSPRMPSA